MTSAAPAHSFSAAMPQALRGSLAARVVGGLALAAASGILAVVSFPPYGLPLIWVAFVPMVVAQHLVLPPRVSGLAVGVAVGIYYQGLFGPTVRASAAAPWYLHWFGLWVAVAGALLAWRGRTFHERTGYRWLVLSAPVAWVAIDFVRGTLTPAAGATWGYVAIALSGHPVVLGPTSLFTVHALNLLVLVVNYAIAAVAVFVVRRPRSLHRPTRVLLAAGIGVVTWCGVGAAVLRDPAPTVRVAAVQPAAADAGQEWARDFAMTREAAQRGAKLVVWREAGLPFDPRAERSAELAALARETGAYLVVGWGWSRDHSGVNAATVVSPEGRFLGTFNKVHPIAMVHDYSRPTKTYPRYDTTFGRLATIICLDSDYTNTTRSWAQRGAGIVAVPSLDNAGIAPLHYRQLSLRAAENRVSMVKADKGWDSAVVDPYGRLVARVVTPGYEEALLVADVAVGSGRTLAGQLPDWFGWVALLAAVGFGGLGMRTRFVARGVRS